jgi:hypothetical protein
VRGDHGDAFHLLLVVFDEPGMLFKSRYILPAVEPEGIDQQPDLPMLANERIDLRAIWRKSSAFNLSGAVILNALAEIISVLIMAKPVP